jgi:hypothetical protein
VAVMREKFDIRLVMAFAALIGFIYALVVFSGKDGYHDRIYCGDNCATYLKTAD